ncbi:hypothetical protein HTZ77_17385 [Nonomuraea sp. SMC257]|uniref:Uncharacterized protein n=1 Tax=Nonomuraea montanisoli TaxID=2741721 RepID=A0A7Y6I7Y2_9ACTN|nr:hypothetical protein [Nonomuraea montanisoli]NUW33191.1 hypothetical protein [Nonomuraea montanisoli]
MKLTSVTLVAACLLIVTIPGGAVQATPESKSLDSVIAAIKKQFAKKAYVRSKNGTYIWKSPSTVGKWINWQNLAGAIWGQDLINGINPGFLKLGASHAATSADGGTFEGVKTTLHSGTVTVPKLDERQAWMYFGTDEEDGSWGGPITWKLWAGPDNLPRRFHAIMRFTPKHGGRKAATMTMNIIYRGWGRTRQDHGPAPAPHHRRLVIADPTRT